MDRRTICKASALSLLMLGTAALRADSPAALSPAAPPPAAAAPTNSVGPIIQFETNLHNFGQTKSGELVKYSYVFTNGGDQLLEVTGVQACGCITADWSRKVEPGKTGSIPVSFNSMGYGGPITKTITVTCNDRTNPRPVLRLTGTIWRPIDIIPQFAVLNLNADAPMASATVLITNNLPDPITLSPPACNNAAFAVELQTNQPGREFRLIVSPAKPLPPGSMQAHISLKTSSTNMPVINVNAFANVQPAVTINPGQIVLPPAPLARPQTNILNIANNSTNAMELSEPAVDATGVNVDLKEAMAGRYFTAKVAFPEGFELAAGRPAELRIKCSLAAMPAIKVPIMQVPRPAPPRPAPPPQQPPTVRTNRRRPLPPIDYPPLPP